MVCQYYGNTTMVVSSNVCVIWLYISLLIYHFFSIILNRPINAPGHGKNAVGDSMQRKSFNPRNKLNLLVI